MFQEEVGRDADKSERNAVVVVPVHAKFPIAKSNNKIKFIRKGAIEGQHSHSWNWTKISVVC